MGAACCKSDGTEMTKSQSHKNTLQVMFDRIDKEKKGYISTKNLEDLMRDDKTYFQGKDAEHIMSKYGEDGKMTFDQFRGWWGGTYTTYGDDMGASGMNLSKLVDEVNEEQKQLDTIEEIAEISENMSELQKGKEIPSSTSNLAVNRS